MQQQFFESWEKTEDPTVVAEKRGHLQAAGRQKIGEKGVNTPTERV